MRRLLPTTACLAALVLAVAAWGCESAGPLDLAGADHPAGGLEGGVNVSLLPTTDGLGVTVWYRQDALAEAPRAGEIWLHHDPELAFVAAEAGSGLEAADKQLVAQAPVEGRVRLVFYAPGNLTRLGDGPLATVRFAALADSTARVSLSPQRPLFAPALADHGVRLGGEVTLQARRQGGARR